MDSTLKTGLEALLRQAHLLMPAASGPSSSTELRKSEARESEAEEGLKVDRVRQATVKKGPPQEPKVPDYS